MLIKATEKEAGFVIPILGGYKVLGNAESSAHALPYVERYAR